MNLRVRSRVVTHVTHTEQLGAPALAAALDPAAFTTLYEVEYLPMLRLAVALVSDRATAEEVVHDAFVALYGRWDRVERPGAYLRTSVVNGCRGVLRRRRLRLRRPQPPIDDLPSPARELLDAVGRLSPRRRAVIVLRFYEDMAEADIARTLGMRAGTVKSTLHAALRDLREVIA